MGGRGAPPLMGPPFASRRRELSFSLRPRRAARASSSASNLSAAASAAAFLAAVPATGAARLGVRVACVRPLSVGAT
jgi:hypothetical protein